MVNKTTPSAYIWQVTFDGQHSGKSSLNKLKSKRSQHRTIIFNRPIQSYWVKMTNIHLILWEFSGVGQEHVLCFRGAVSCGQSQTPQRVPTCPILANNRHDLFLDALSEGDFSVAHSDVSASVDDALWGPLGSRTGMLIIPTEPNAADRFSALFPFLCTFTNILPTEERDLLGVQ